MIKAQVFLDTAQDTITVSYVLCSVKCWQFSHPKMIKAQDVHILIVPSDGV